MTRETVTDAKAAKPLLSALHCCGCGSTLGDRARTFPLPAGVSVALALMHV